MQIDVQVIEPRHSFGRERYLVQPVSGKGTSVVEINTDHLTKKDPLC